MTLTDEQRADLEMMRNAARQREWTTLQDTFKRLLSDVEPLIALSITARQMQKFLPKFEKAYPEAGWVRELLLTVMSYASAPSPNDLPIAAINQFPSPGMGNFIMAVFDLARSVRTEYTVFERYSHITNATANVLLADLQHFYFERHPDAYTALRDPDTPEADRAEIQGRFWVDKHVAWRDAATWLEVIDDLQTKLEEK